MISPCVKVCVMDAERRYCLGCARTLDEIAHWGEMSDGERARVLESLPARLVLLAARQRRTEQ